MRMNLSLENEMVSNNKKIQLKRTILSQKEMKISHFFVDCNSVLHLHDQIFKFEFKELIWCELECEFYNRFL